MGGEGGCAVTEVIVPLAQVFISPEEVEELGWQDRALCAQTDPEAFFPEKGGSTRLASRVEPPFSGKNASGSVCAHSARSCQPRSSMSSGRTTTCVSGTMTSVIAHPPSRSPRDTSPHSREGENHTNEITPACLALSQARNVVLAAWLSKMHGKFPEKLQRVIDR